MTQVSAVAGETVQGLSLDDVQQLTKQAGRDLNAFGLLLGFICLPGT